MTDASPLASDRASDRAPDRAPDRAAPEAPPASAGPPARYAGRSGRWWTLAALLVFLAAALYGSRGLLGRDPRAVVPANAPASLGSERGSGQWQTLAETDLRFVVWLVARNAYVLTHRPLRLFDAEQCHPARGALALGEPGIAFGVLAIPAYLLSRDPVVTFNATLIVSAILSAWAMFLLVREWTGSPPAGIAAGLAYTFHVLKVGDVVHIIAWDTTWTVFALFFSVRFFERGRWRDALGLAAAVSLQIAGSLYPLLAAVVLALPFVVWLVRAYGFAKLRPAQCVALALAVGLVVAVVLGPYLGKSSSGEIEPTPYQAYFSLHYILPGGGGFAGWLILPLALASLVPARWRGPAATGPDPRWALLAGGLLITSLSILAAGEPGERTVPVIRGDLPA